MRAPPATATVSTPANGEKLRTTRYAKDAKSTSSNTRISSIRSSWGRTESVKTFIGWGRTGSVKKHHLLGTALRDYPVRSGCHCSPSAMIRSSSASYEIPIFSADSAKSSP